jgi:acetyl-CoA acyltransferase 1
VRQSLESIRQKNRDDVVITVRPLLLSPFPSLLSDVDDMQFAKRTALTRAKKGAFRDTSSDTLLHSLLQKGMDQSGVDRNIVGDIIAGVCHTPSPAYEVRAASLAAGFPETTPAEAVNRLCSSGLMAIRHISDSVARGELEVGVAVGYESMSSQ